MEMAYERDRVRPPGATAHLGDRSHTAPPVGADPMQPLLIGMGWTPPQHGGLNRYFRCLHATLEEAGQRPTGVILGPAPEAPESVRVVSDHQAPLRSRLVALARSLRLLPTDPGVVDAHFALYALPARLLPRLRGTPFVVHFQGPWAHESALTGVGPVVVGLKRCLERWVYRQADALVVLSPAFGDLLVRQYGVAPWKVHVEPPGVDPDIFSPGDRAGARRRLGLDPDSWIVLSVRRLVPRMGIDVLLDAWPAVRSARPDAVLVLVGDGPERGALQRQAARSGGDGSVRLLGEIGDRELVDAYRAADVSVVPSLSLEGFGLVSLESMACGTPVVVTAVDGLAAIPAALDPTTVVPPGDAGALAGRISSAADGSLPLPSAQACRRVAVHHSWKAVGERHVELYRAVAHPGTAPSKLRVVYVDHTAQLSGGELALLRLLASLVDVEAHVILGEDGPLAARLGDAGVSAEVLEMPSAVRDARRGSVIPRSSLPRALRTVAYSLRLARRLRALRPDLVHTNSLKAAVYGGLAARLAGVPVLWHIRDRISPDYLPRPAVRLVRLLARRIPRTVVANSAATLATLGTGIADCRAIPDLVVVDAAPGRLPRSPSQDRPLVVGMVGRLSPWKGQDVFLRAFSAALGGTQARALVVGGALFGEDAYEQSLHALVEELGLQRQVELTGHRDPVANELALLDVLVHASVIPEPFGQVVLEGMAAGLAVVAADAGGPAEVIHHEVDGLLVPPGDVAALARALERLAGDADLRDRLGRSARLEAKHYTGEVIVPQVMAAYRSSLDTSLMAGL